MKILHLVEFYSPSVGGAQEVVRQLSEHMVLQGHDVTVATSKIPNRNFKHLNGVKILEFDVKGNEVRGYSGKDIKKFQSYLIKSSYDIIMNYAAQQWTTDLTFSVIDQLNAKKVFVPCGYSGLYDPAYTEYFKKLPSILKKYNKVVYLSNDYRDINFAKKHGIKNGVVIPNGADEREFDLLQKVNKSELFSKYGIPKGNKIILNVSNHTGAKGHKEAVKAFKSAKIKNTSLVLVGDINKHSGCYTSCFRSAMISKAKYYITGSRKTIHMLSLDRASTIKFYTICDIFFFLSNIECSPLVLFESAAAGKPFISSDAGNAREIADWTGAGLIADSYQSKSGYTNVNVQDATTLIEELIHNEALSKKMGRIGRSTWRKRFTWRKISRDYLKLYTTN